MRPEDGQDRLERHALVLALWLPLGLVAAGAFATGLAAAGAGPGAGAWAGAGWIAAGYGALLLAFGGHVIVNAALGTGFSGREVAFALVAYGISLIALLLAALLLPGFGARHFPALALGHGALAAAALVYMVVAFGPRGAFDRFDVIRDNNRRAASRLPHRGGRR